jgi:hypothetical protein
VIDDADQLEAALEGRVLSAELPDRLVRLLDVAAEVTRALAVPVLSAADRERLYGRVMRPPSWAARVRHELPRLARRRSVVGGAAAVTLAALGIAVLRGRSHPELGELGTAV